MPDIIDDVTAAWDLYATEMARLPNVVTVGMGYRIRGGKQTRTPALVVTVRRKVAPEVLGPSSICPREVLLPNGRTVDVDVVEDPTADYTLQQDRAVYRPVPGGCEIGPLGSGFVGTLGGWFCRPDMTGSGWEPVWLSNAHVVDVVNAAAVPADPRMSQPGGGDVFGQTVAVSGYPNPGPPAGATVNGICDAAVGMAAEGVDADYQVLQIAPAPFELGTATVGMAVQKRGRTSLLTQGTVAGTAGMPPWITVTIGSPNSAGQVVFGTPGNPRVLRVNSNATGLAAAFTRPGDSGSLYFGQLAGQIDSTFPCLGLHFAGNFSGVAAQPNPNLSTVTSVGFDIGGVMQVLQLETVCNCVIRAVLDAIFGRSESEAAREVGAVGESGSRRRGAERMMRRFRDTVLARSSVGRRLADAVAQTAPHMARLLSQDPVAFGLMVDLLRPWAAASSSLAVLGAKLDADTIRTARELADRMMELSPQTEARIRPLVALLEGREGQPVSRLIGRLKSPEVPDVDRPEPKGRGRKPRKRGRGKTD